LCPCGAPGKFTDFYLNGEPAAFSEREGGFPGWRLRPFFGSWQF
jgi:hypothetical protein